MLQDDYKKMLIIPKSLLPQDAKQGDVLKRCDDGCYQHDRAQTTERRERIYRLEQILRGKRKDG